MKGEDRNHKTPEEYIAEVEREKRIFRQKLAALKDSPPRSRHTAGLDYIILKLNNRQIQLILRETAFALLARAISGCGGNVILRVMRNMGDRGAMVLLEEIDYNRNLPEKEIASSQEEIIKTYHRLSKDPAFNR